MLTLSHKNDLQGKPTELYYVRHARSWNRRTLKKVAWSSQEINSGHPGLGFLFLGSFFSALTCGSIGLALLLASATTHEAWKSLGVLAIGGVFASSFVYSIMWGMRPWRQEWTVKKQKAAKRLILVKYGDDKRSFAASSSLALDALLNTEIGRILWEAMQDDLTRDAKEMRRRLRRLEKGRHDTLFVRLQPFLDDYLDSTEAYAATLAEVEANATPVVFQEGLRQLGILAQETAAMMEVVIERYREEQAHLTSLKNESDRTIADARLGWALGPLP